MSSKASERQQTFTEVMKEYAQLIPENATITKQFFDLYKDTIYGAVYELIEAIFTDFTSPLPYKFFKNLSRDVITRSVNSPLKLSYYQNLNAVITSTEGWIQNADHYLRQLKHYVVFCLYCELNFRSSKTRGEFDVLRTSQPPNFLSLFMYHGDCVNVKNEPDKTTEEYKYRYFSITPLNKPSFWSVDFTLLFKSVFFEGILKSKQRDMIKSENEELIRNYDLIIKSIEQLISSPGGNTEENRKDLEDFISNKSTIMDISPTETLKEINPRFINIFKDKTFEGSHRGDVSQYNFGFYLLPNLLDESSNSIIESQLDKSILPPPIPIIYFLNSYISLKKDSGDSDTEDLILCLPEFVINSSNYYDFITKCIDALKRKKSPIEVTKKCGNQFGSWMYEYLNYFVTIYGDENQKRYFFALFGCGRSATPIETDRYIDDYVVPIQFLLSLIQGYCGPTIILDSSCNNEDIKTQDYTLTDATQPDEAGGGTRKKKYKKYKKQSKKSKKNKKSKKRRIFRKK